MLHPPALGFSPHPPVSVYGTGAVCTIAAFLDSWLTHFPTKFRSASRLPIAWRLFLPGWYPACARLSIRACAFPLCPHSSDIQQYRNLNLLSIGYASRPRLRPRLTQSRSALLWKPWIFGLEDSHLHLATHSGILSPCTPQPLPVLLRRACNAPLPIRSDSSASVPCFSPGHFRRRTSRPVSYYALFECVAASEPTSWLSLKSHILFHLTRTLGP